MPVIEPQKITPAEFQSRTASWTDIVNGTNIYNLRACFDSKSECMNFAYLSHDMACLLVADSDTVTVQSMFAVQPTPAGDTTFSLVFFGINSAGVRNTDYLLAGVTELPAEIEVEPDAANAEIPYAKAVAMIKSWNALTLDTLDFTQFDTPGDAGRLRGYAHDAKDFVRACANEAYNGLWFNFARHTDEGAPNSFVTVMCLNDLPIDGTRSKLVMSPKAVYYDLSKPCPPLCGPAQ